VKKGKRNSWYFVLLALVSVAVVVVLFLVQPPRGVDTLVRAAALLGYLAVFFATLSSAYLRELVKFFGRPFTKIHHIVSIAGLVLITIHPLAAAWSWSSANVLLPQFDSLRTFLTWGGPPALYLLAIATIGVLLRRRLKRRWRSIHSLNYIAFLLATVHALLLGTDGQLLGVRIVATAMALVVICVYIRKHRPRGRQPST
jgi:DMSO/TMAO reductase YedYZ heme-binding membrane subunit